MKKKLVVVTVVANEWCQGRSAEPETLMDGAERSGASSCASAATLSAAQTVAGKRKRKRARMRT